MEVTVDIPERVVGEILDEHDDFEQAIQEAVFGWHVSQDVPPEVREVVREDIARLQ